jgi:DNA-binding XRE family transcriptional regulator
MTISAHTISKEIQALREAFGCSQEAMARVIGVSSRSVVRWEHEEAQPNFLVKQKLDELLALSAKAQGIIQKGKTSEWFNASVETLGFKTPLEIIMQGSAGVREITDLLGRLEWGISE